MNTIFVNEKLQIPFSDLRFRFSRSGGPGGQNVNKVSTRVELIFDLRLSALDPILKAQLTNALKSRLDSAGCLRVVSQESRSQWKNKQDAIDRFTSILKKALQPVKHRTPTRATKTSKEKRLNQKRGRGKIKEMRKVRVDKEIT
jgi:ribosome-associated protein